MDFYTLGALAVFEKIGMTDVGINRFLGGILKKPNLGGMAQHTAQTGQIIGVPGVNIAKQQVGTGAVGSAPSSLGKWGRRAAIGTGALGLGAAGVGLYTANRNERQYPSENPQTYM